MFFLDDKCSCTWIDTGDSIGATGCLEANLACGIVAVETEVHWVTAIWSSAQWDRGSGLCHKAHNSLQLILQRYKFGTLIKH
jgi:hypothetical protein